MGENISVMGSSVAATFTVIGLQLLILILGFAAKAVVLTGFSG